MAILGVLLGMLKLVPGINLRVFVPHNHWNSFQIGDDLEALFVRYIQWKLLKFCLKSACVTSYYQFQNVVVRRTKSSSRYLPDHLSDFVDELLSAKA